MEKSDNRYWRYITVRIVSRVIDIAIYIGMILYFGVEFLLIAFFVSGIVSYIIDFCFQKVWVFNETLIPKKALLEFGWYTFVRGSLGLVVFGAFYVMDQVMQLSTAATIAITFCVIWPIAYQIYKKFIFKTGAR